MSAVHAADAELFDEAMSCHDVVPVDFVAFDAAPADVRVTTMFDRADALLRTITQIEDGAADDAEDRADPVLQRLEAKINVLLDLVGTVVGRSLDAPPARDVRWSRKGLAMALGAEAATLPAVGAHGLLRVQPATWLPQMLELPARVLAAEGDGERRVWLRLDPLPPALESALERHLFRQHRRTIARSRVVRPGR